MDLGQLSALAAVVAEGTFEAAARALHVTPSALSQRIRALESSTGQVLVVRSRPVAVTSAGEVLLRLAHQVEVLTADARRELRGRAAGAAGADEQERAVLPVAVNADSLATWLLPALAPLAERAVLGLHRADQERTAALLRAGTVVGAITTSPQPVSGCAATALGAMTYRPLAAPDFAARWFARGPVPGALARAPVVVFDRDDDLQHGYLRARADPRGPALAPPVHHVPASADFVRAVELGLGWGMVPDLQSSALVDAGALVVVDAGGAVDVPLHWQRWTLRSAALDELTDAVVGAARAVLAQGPRTASAGRRRR